MRRPVLTLITVSTLLLGISLGVFTATITVPDDYTTIQAAIDAADSGDTVYIKAGRYTENIIIDKPLRLVGESRSNVRIVAETPMRPVVLVVLDSSEAVLERFSVSGGAYGILINTLTQGNVHVLDMLILENSTGVNVFGKGSVVVGQCLLVDNDFGVVLVGTHTEMVDSEIARGTAGVILAGSGNVTMSRCLIGLVQIGVSTYASGCRWEAGLETYSGTLNGDDNRIFGTLGDLCPERIEGPWPEEFTDGAWRETVEEIVRAFYGGVSAYQAQDYSGSLDAFSRALSLFGSTGASFPLLRSYVLENIGNVYADVGQYEDALEAYRSARTIYVEREMGVDVAEIDENIGGVYESLGRYEEALETFRSARAVYVEREMEVGIARIDENIGVVYWNLGQYEDALEAYRYARAVYVEREIEVNVARIDTCIGVVYTSLGRYEDALEKYRPARDVYVKREMEVDVADIDTNIGNVYADVGQYEDALEAYRSARAVYVKREMEVGIARIDNNIGGVYTSLGRYEEALEAYRSTRAVYVKREMEVGIARIDNNIGNAYWNLGRYEEALEAYRSALERLDLIAPVRGMTFSYPASRWTLYSNMGSAHEAHEEWDKAVTAYENAIAVIESIRGGLTSEDLKTAWQEQTRDVYERLIDLLYRMGQGSSAFMYAERCRARTFLDSLYQGSITPEQLISPEAGISSGAVDPEAIDAAVKVAQEDLQSNEAVLEYMVTDAGVYLWLITSSGIGYPEFIEYPREQLMNDVITFRVALESLDPDPITATEFLVSFYDKLVKDSLATLPDGVDTLILIPSGPLWYLPFSALMMTDQELMPDSRVAYLIEHFTLAYLPSLASLSSLAQQEAQATSGGPLLALADPELPLDELHEGEESKCGADEELARYEELVTACQAFADLLAGEEQETQFVYAGREAQEVLAHQGSGRQVVVYAAHGQFNPYVPLQSKLLLASGEEGTTVPGDSRVSDGNYYAWEVLLTDYRATELVVLAACETLLPHLKDVKGTMAVLGDQACDEVELTPQQLERIVVGDEVVGLARAFLSSGAEAVLGTLWLANPSAIEKLLVSMAEHYKQGATWVQALTKAQRELIANPTFGNVWFWAPYQLIGRWR